MSNIIDKIQVSGVTYDIGGTGGGGNPTVELTQAEYDALVTAGTVSADTYYIITDAQAGDLTNYYTKTETNTLLGGKADTATTYTKTEVDNAITAATSAKQDTLVSGTNIKTINNTSILGSGNIDIQGGKAVAAGTNISVTTGETADTINCTLNASNGTGSGSIKFGNSSNVSSQQFSVAFGSGTQAKGIASIAEGESTQTTAWYCHSSGYKTLASGKWSNAEGYQTTASTQYSHTEGIGTKVSNNGEHSQGMYNTSSSDGTTSGNTLFSVGNGTADNARHNAFEIRQNGDIYLSSGGTDIKLQDHLGGGGGGSITIDPSLDDSSTNPVANSAITETLGKFYYSRKLNNSIYSSPWGTQSSNGCIAFTLEFANILNPNDSVSSGVWLSKINNKELLYTGVTPPSANNFNLNLVETSAITTSISSSSTDAQVPSAKAVNDKLGGLSLVKLTQAQYDALVTKDNSTLYVIVN